MLTSNWNNHNYFIIDIKLGQIESPLKTHIIHDLHVTLSSVVCVWTIAGRRPNRQLWHSFRLSTDSYSRYVGDMGYSPELSNFMFDSPLGCLLTPTCHVNLYACDFRRDPLCNSRTTGFQKKTDKAEACHCYWEIIRMCILLIFHWIWHDDERKHLLNLKQFAR